MRPQLTLLASLPVLVACSSRAIIHVSAGRSNLTLHAHVVKGAAVLPLTKAPLGLLLASDDACTSIVKPTWRRPFAVFARSGGCPLEAKVRTASIAGASALIVADTLTTLYEPLSNDTAASMSLRDPCAVHCDAGRGTIDTGTVNIASVLRGLPGRCPAPDSYIGKRCPTELCAFSRAASTSSASREVCCVLESRAPEPSLTVGNRSLPVLTLSLSLSEVLEGTCATSACTTSTCAVPACTLAVAAQAEPPVGVGAWDGSALIMWALAVGTAALASFLAASENHQQDAELLAEEAGGGRSPGAAALAAATIDASTALSFLVMASAGLLALYFAIQAGFDGVILVINVLFIFATATATAQVLLVPSLVACSSPSIRGATVGLPAWLASALSLGGAPSSTPSSEVDNDTAGGATANTVGEGASVPLLPLLGTVLAFALSISWFLLRKQPWMWLLQDALSMMVCVLFVRTIRLPSLKLAALFLGLMFFYDIFMVFISPLVFHKSVMLEVALRRRSNPFAPSPVTHLMHSPHVWRRLCLGRSHWRANPRTRSVRSANACAPKARTCRCSWPSLARPPMSPCTRVSIRRHGHHHSYHLLMPPMASALCSGASPARLATLA